MGPTPDELSMPHFEDRLWGELEAHHRTRRRDAAPIARPGRRRGALLMGAAAVAAAIVVVATLVADVPGAEPPPAEASVVERVLAATDAGDAIIHETVQGEDGTTTRERWYDEVTAAERSRAVSANGDPLTDGGWPQPPTVDEAPHPNLVGPATEVGECDPLTRLSMDDQGGLHPCEPDEPQPSQPEHAYRTVDHCRRVYVDGTSALVLHQGWGYLRMYLETGQVVEDGTEAFDGRELLRLRNTAGTFTFLVDPETSLPVRMTETTPDGLTSTTTTYERLDRTPEHLARLSPPVPEGFTPAQPPPDTGPPVVTEDAGGPPGQGADCSAPAGAAGWNVGGEVVEEVPEGD